MFQDEPYTLGEFLQSCGLCIVAGLLVAAFLGGCAPAKSANTQRAEARGAVTALSVAVEHTNGFCAKYPAGSSSRKRCNSAYDYAKATLAAVKDTIDAASAVARGDVACAVRDATDGLDALADAAWAEPGHRPVLVADALLLGTELGSGCEGQK